MKNIYITWHYTTHGIAYLKHVLSKFYISESIPKERIDLDEIKQEEMNEVFDKPFDNGFTFDEIIYLTAEQEAFDRLSARNSTYKYNILEDDMIKEKGLIELYKTILDNKICYQLDAELKFVEEESPELLEGFKSTIWRNLQHYPIQEQIKWLKEHSNFSKVYPKNVFKEKKLKIKDLRDEKEIAQVLNDWYQSYFKDKSTDTQIINASLGSNETQVVWHILSQSKQLKRNARLIKTYDDKSNKKYKRFKPFSIKEVPSNLIDTIHSGFNIYRNTKSPNRELINRKMEVFLKSGFSILLIGERGIGKTQIAENAKKEQTFIAANCASFDDDSKAEAELFGYKKGAFTGANSNKKGLMLEANGGILFLDEIHHLSKMVQAKLMKALQTDKNNKMKVRPIGGKKEEETECKLIFATNVGIDELRNCLLPDFYDRIVQQVIEIPPLRETPQDRLEDWREVWKNLKFTNAQNAPENHRILDWLKNLPLYGNYRDLQKIAIHYNTFNSFDQETQSMLEEKSAFEYAKKQFERYCSIKSYTKADIFNFQIGQTDKEMRAEYLFELQEWAVASYGNRKEAAKQLDVSTKTLNNWKNKSLLKK